MTGGLDRLLRPRSIAVIGGGAWCANVIRECRKIGFAGDIWPVHPLKPEIGGLAAVPHIEDLPRAPDAAFIGVNREITITAVRLLAMRGAGGAVCFASGFREAVAETGDGDDMQAALLDAAGEMPILGPNCYGFINGLDGAALWPDQHGMTRVERGVALVTQSSNIALNLTMQRRGLPLAYLVTAGNQAQTDLAGIGSALLQDPRVTALGLHIEGVGDLRRFEAMAATARHLGKPIVVLKAGASDQARVATVSHTASLAGSEAGSRALFWRLGIGQVDGLAELLEALKLMHVTGPLGSNRIGSMSCSGGEASLMADAAHGLDLVYPPLNRAQSTELRAALGPKVALANPLDYHTYIWGDRAALARCFTAMMDPGLALGCVLLDFPRADRCEAAEWDDVVDAVAEAQAARGVPMALLASLPETMPEEVAEVCMVRGIVPLAGLGDALRAIEVAAGMARAPDVAEPLLLPGPDGPSRLLSEADAKAALAAHGLPVPSSHRAATGEEAAQAAARIGFPVALKGEHVAHKTEAGAVALNLCSVADVRAAAGRMAAGSFLVEVMVDDAVAELLVGVLRDPAHGFVLTIGAGGTLTELLADTVSMLLPVTGAEIDAALDRLRLAPLLDGYRGAPAADRSAIVSAVLAVQDYVTANAGTADEVEINPLLCTPTGAIAVDALIRLKETT
ncbi:MAG: acetate--CoA ligase family protein [Rhodobacteraceae bacterium]|nr:acetate--CoA ligase family protein [Paracoccaceae bacterium]